MSGERRISRRRVATGVVAGAVGLTAGSALSSQGEEKVMSGTVFDVKVMGAAGDGKTDDTAVFQKALDAAGECGGVVLAPPGRYLTGELQMRRDTTLKGMASWSYRKPGGTILQLADEKARCLVNMTGAIGATIQGMCLEGDRLGSDVHGVLMDKEDYGREEDTICIERSKIARFSGDGVRLVRNWVFTIRHSMIAFNGGDGVNAEGWDGFLMDNWLSGNGGAGYGRGDHCSVTMTGNRIEWNREGGILLRAGSHYNITGNYIDRSGKAGIALLGEGDAACKWITATGNLIYRSGKHAEDETHDSSHIRIDSALGLTLTANTLHAGRDDGQKGKWSPSYGVVYKSLENCVLKDNVLHDGATKELLVDLGGHGEGAIVKDNPGCVMQTS